MLHEISACFLRFPDRNALYIKGQYYTYRELAGKVAGVQKILLEENTGQQVAIAAYDDADTYAGILACLFSGKTYVPLNPENPPSRNAGIVMQAEACTLITSRPGEIQSLSGNNPAFDRVIHPSEISADSLPVAVEQDDRVPAYLLFTSGSTGQPKGVPVTRDSVRAFLNAFFSMGYPMDETDRVLQMFDLTFDLSVMSYMAPLMKGACMYTVPQGEIKYTSVYEILEDHEITVALMVPSVLGFLSRYFDEIRLEKLKYSLFCGEALHQNLAAGWSACVPNARIQNVYGPTEATVFCLAYDIPATPVNARSYNGIISIGTPMAGTVAMVAGDDSLPLPDGQHGELCLSGRQLTPGYWKNDEKNKESFFEINYKGSLRRFYRTGDICYREEDGVYMFCGRKDNQVKIQGFRVELSEIEHHAMQFEGVQAAVAVAVHDALGNTAISLAVHGNTADADALRQLLKNQLPSYMIPSGIFFLGSFPLNQNGKIDRKKIREQVIEKQNNVK